MQFNIVLFIVPIKSVRSQVLKLLQVVTRKGFNVSGRKSQHTSGKPEVKGKYGKEEIKYLFIFWDGIFRVISSVGMGSK